MNLRAALARLFGLAAIIAVLAFASPAAEAHSGHKNGGHVHTGAAPVVLALQLPAPTVSLDRLSVQTEQVLTDAAGHDHDTAELRSTPASVPAEDSAGCIQSCCAGAPCHSGAAHALGSELSEMAPQDAGIGFVVWDALRIAGHDPEGLRKPPRTFV